MAVIQSLFGRQAGGGPDPFWTSVVSLLWFNGNLTDQRGKSWAAVNGAATSSVQSRFGGASLRLDPSQGIQASASADFDFPGNFAIDCWLYFTSFGSATEIFTRGGAAGGLSVSFSPSGGCQIDQHGSGNVLNVGTQIPLNQWVHFAVTREPTAGGFIRVFYDGVLVGANSASGNDFTALGAPAFVGPTVGGGVFIDDFRVTKGAARYTSNFTPPAFQAPNF